MEEFITNSNVPNLSVWYPNSKLFKKALELKIFLWLEPINFSQKESNISDCYEFYPYINTDILTELINVPWVDQNHWLENLKVKWHRKSEKLIHRFSLQDYWWFLTLSGYHKPLQQWPIHWSPIVYFVSDWQQFEATAELSLLLLLLLEPNKKHKRVSWLSWSNITSFFSHMKLIKPYVICIKYLSTRQFHIL